MRRLLRWAWNALAALSLLLCVAACVLWVRSYRWDDRVYVQFEGGPIWSAASTRGVVWFSRAPWQNRPTGIGGWTSPASGLPFARQFSTPRKDTLWFRLGFATDSWEWRGAPGVGRVVTAPHWSLALFFGAAAAALWTPALLRRRR